jgi:hypothetical protein
MSTSYMPGGQGPSRTVEPRNKNTFRKDTSELITDAIRKFVSYWLNNFNSSVPGHSIALLCSLIYSNVGQVMIWKRRILTAGVSHAVNRTT